MRSSSTGSRSKILTTALAAETQQARAAQTTVTGSGAVVQAASTAGAVAAVSGIVATQQPQAAQAER